MITDKENEKVLDRLPHGSGIDCDWHIQPTGIVVKTFEGQHKTIQALECTNEYHALSDTDLYVGYIPFTAYIDRATMELVELTYCETTAYIIENNNAGVYLAALDDYLWQTVYWTE